MKTKHILGMAVLLLAGAACSDDKESFDFVLDTNELKMEAVGGTQDVKVTVPGEWTATASQPWVKVSPTNGRGTEICTISVDTTLLANETRSAVVRFATRTDAEARTISITQEGFPHALTLSETNIALENYAELDKRHFDIEVTSNVNFEVVIPQEAQSWLTHENYQFKLDAGARPRTTTIRFNWEGNSNPEAREAKIEFKVAEEDLVQHDAILIIQGRAPEITPDRQGDSLALVLIEQKLNVMIPWNKSESMDYWAEVDLWDVTDPGYEEEKEGRVRSLGFSQFTVADTEKFPPAEIAHLKYLETLSFFSNGNENFKSVKVAPVIGELKNLKNLRLYSVGVTELPQEFANLKELETLILSGNNFQTLPTVLTPNNLPKLKNLDLSTNRRIGHIDLTQITDPTDKWGGFYGNNLDDDSAPNKVLETLLLWDNLESLQLSNNILKGTIPDMKGRRPVWDGTEFGGDTLANAMDTLRLHQVPRVLPRCKMLKINLNYLHGSLPDWMKYHPFLMFWTPESVVFPQNEAPDDKGNMPGLTGIPQSFEYYYDMYPLFEPEY